MMDDVAKEPPETLIGNKLSRIAWQIAAEALPTPIFTAARDGTIDFVNRAWFSLTGYATSDRFTNARFAEMVHPEDLAAVQSLWQHAVARGAHFEAQHRIRKADGSFIWIWSRATPVRDAAGEVSRWYGTTTDIQQLKAAEQRLRVQEIQLHNSERQFRALAQAVPVILWTATADGWIDWYNRGWYEYTGQTAEEAEGWGWQAAHHPDDFPEVMRRWPDAILTGQTFEMEFRLRRADGAFHWFLTRVHPMYADDGSVMRWYGTNVDIDAQRKAQERSNTIAETLQQVFLPVRLPHNDAVRFDAVYIPAERDALIGGDWYDAFELADGRIAFSIGDVAGHGISASVIAGSLRQSIFALTFRVTEPAELLRDANRLLQHRYPDTIATAIVGYIEPSANIIRFANAGHPPPIVGYVGDTNVVEFEYGGIPLGVLTDLGDINTTVVPIRKEMVLALYTDGLTEAGRNIASAEQRLKVAISKIAGDVTLAHPAEVVRREVLDGLATVDDAAVVLMQFSNISRDQLDRAPSELTKTWRFHSSDALAASSSRRELTAYLSERAADPSETFIAELVLGEMLANTVMHAPGLVEIDIDWTGEKPVVRIRDTGPGLNELAAELPTEVFDERGRGMFLIKTFAEDVVVRAALGFGAEFCATLRLKRKIDSSATGAYSQSA